MVVGNHDAHYHKLLYCWVLMTDALQIVIIAIAESIYGQKSWVIQVYPVICSLVGNQKTFSVVILSLKYMNTN